MHFAAPATMLATFAIGVGFALGHHFFFQSLHGTPVDATTFDQQINIVAGIAFAYLVQFALNGAVGVAFVQVLWRNLLSKSIPVARIDSMTQLSTNFFEVFNLQTLWHFPVLGALAIISWALPVAMTVPPATLSVVIPAEPFTDFAIRDLPNLDFSKTEYTKLYISSGPDILSDQGAPNQVQREFFGGGSDALSQLAVTTALQGELPTIAPPSVNSSYSMEFFAPSLQCEPMPATLMTDFNDVFGCNFTQTGSRDNTSCGFDYTYLTWVPSASSRVPVTASDGLVNFSPKYDGSGYGLTTIGGFETEPAAIYIGTQHVSNEWALLNCSLYNASYGVSFDFRNGNQTLSTTRVELLGGLPFINLVQTTMLADLPGQPPAGTTTPNAAADAVSFQAVMESFCRFMVGGISYAISATGGGDNIAATSIMSTRLGGLVELGGNDTSLTLAAAAEQLFANITLGLFSKPALYATADAAEFPRTNVTLSTFPPTYEYTWRRLVLAYGLALLFAALAVLIGGLALLAAGEGYTYKFSTIVRTTRDPAIDTIVMPQDARGENPLPQRIGSACVAVGIGKEYSAGRGAVVSGMSQMTQPQAQPQPRRTWEKQQQQQQQQQQQNT